MTVSIMIRISDKTLSKLAESAREQGCGIREHISLILDATMAIYRTEGRTGKPTGPNTASLRKWRPAHIIHPELGSGNVVASLMGDPAPGRSALDQKRAQG